MGAAPRRLAAELPAAGRRDLKAAVWYRWIYLAGVVTSGWYLVLHVVPATWRRLHWMLVALLHNGPERFAFWEALIFGTVVLAPIIAPGVIALRARRLRNGARRDGVLPARQHPARRGGAADPHPDGEPAA